MGGKMHRGSNTQNPRVDSCSLPLCHAKVSNNALQKNMLLKASDQKDWKDATCSVCLEYPHNAILLLCSSYDKGCHPYMCATSYRYSNCLDQYKKAYSKVTPGQNEQSWNGSMDDNPNCNSGFNWFEKKMEEPELLCPLCRGQVKGWTVVEPARKYLNKKERTCMQDNCSFVGNYKELRKHVRAQHPRASPREVDPSLVEKWKKLEHERELDDVWSAIRSTMPGAIVMGDYVIERNFRSFPMNYDVDTYLHDALHRLESYGTGRNDHARSEHIFGRNRHSWDEDSMAMHHSRTTTPSARIPHFFRFHSRLLLRGLRRRQRLRTVNRGRLFAFN